MSQNIVTPGPDNTLFNASGEQVIPPDNWAFLPAGDAGLTRKITTQGTFWRVQIKKGRRTISKGIWAPSKMIEKARYEIESTRKTTAYKKARKMASKRREQKQLEYEKEFFNAVETFLSFPDAHKKTALLFARAVTRHAIPVGSGTVARTSMIPIEERASRAVIAWMRHNTTAYHQMSIQHIRGERRKVRRFLAEQSTQILERYRKGLPIDKNCPLQKALKEQNMGD